MAAHNEIHLENYIVQRLVKDCGWKEGKPEDYDKERAIFPEDAIQWVKSTQSEAWDKLVKNNGKSANSVVTAK